MQQLTYTKVIYYILALELQEKVSNITNREKRIQIILNYLRDSIGKNFKSRSCLK